MFQIPSDKLEENDDDSSESETESAKYDYDINYSQNWRDIYLANVDSSSFYLGDTVGWF